MRGGDAIIKALMDKGVDTIFGYPGGTVIPFYDMLYDSDLRHILVRHEQCAAHAAEGYARASGKVGVCLATSGPGATNLVTGIANAYMDSSPIIAITGQVVSNLIGNDAFQEVDIMGITMPITKHSYQPKDANDIPSIINTSFEIASTGRNGPVLIDVPKEVQEQELDDYVLGTIPTPGYKPTIKGNSKQIAKAAQMLKSAERPFILAGGGTILAGAGEEVKKLAATPCNYPILKATFLFSCLTGLRKSDIEKLTWGEIHKQGNFTRIIFKQKKTGGQEYLDISEEAVAYLGTRRNDVDRVFEGFTYGTWISLELKRWALAAGITKNITFHCARHTFAVMMLDLGADIYTVSKLLGHRELSTTQIYAKVLDKNKQAAVSLIPKISD
jgi:hypothetical protein